MSETIQVGRLRKALSEIRALASMKNHSAYPLSTKPLPEIHRVATEALAIDAGEVCASCQGLAVEGEPSCPSCGSKDAYRIEAEQRKQEKAS